MDFGGLNDIKAILRSLVQSTTQKVNIENLNRDYYDMFGEDIPFKIYGYNNLENFLRSLQDTLCIIGSGRKAQVVFIENTKSRHVLDLIKDQRQREALPFSSRRTVSRQLTKQTKKQWNNEYAVGTKFLNEPAIFTNSSKKEAAEMNKSIHMNDLEDNNLNKHKKGLSKNIESSIKISVDSTKHVNVNKAQINLDIVSCTSDLNQTVNDKARKIFNANGNKNDLSWDDVLSVHDGNEKRSIEKCKLSGASKNKSEFKVVAKKPIINLNTNQITTDAERIFDVNKTKVEINLEDAIPTFALSHAIYCLDLPKFAVPFGTKIPSYTLGEDVQINSRLQIFISEVHNPFRFWFQIQNDKNELDELMFKIENYYGKLNDDDLYIPLECITRGQVCCAMYNGLWHRAEILTNPSNHRAKVFFMDYGTVADVNVRNIKYLNLSFARLPAQAIRGSLSHIKPIALHWTIKATAYFLSLVTELMLYVQISEIDKEENVVYMVACESHKDVVQINTALIKNNYALYNNDWDHIKIQLNGGQRRHHPREDFPKFSMLESGDYPTLTDLIYLLEERGIDYESIHDKIIYNTEAILNKNPKAPECIRNLPFYLLTTNPFRYDILLQLLNNNYNDNNNNGNKENNHNTLSFD